MNVCAIFERCELVYTGIILLELNVSIVCVHTVSGCDIIVAEWSISLD